VSCEDKKVALHGCGFCSGCNKVWCDKYVDKGTMLEIKEVAAIVSRNKKPEQAVFKEQSRSHRRQQKQQTDKHDRTLVSKS
jgi:hypothetical protein